MCYLLSTAKINKEMISTLTSGGILGLVNLLRADTDQGQGENVACEKIWKYKNIQGRDKINNTDWN